MLRDWQLKSLVVAALVAAAGAAYHPSGQCGERIAIGTVFLLMDC